MSSAKAESKSNLGRLLVTGFILLWGIGMLMMVNAIKPTEFIDINFTMQNWGRALSIGAFGVLVLLASLQKNLFWDFGKRKDNLDEREVALRRKIFERSYKLAVLLTAIAFYIFLGNTNWVISNLQNPIGSDMQWFMLDFLVLLLGLPSLIGAWHDNGQMFSRSEDKTDNQKTKADTGTWVVRIWLLLWLSFVVMVVMPDLTGNLFPVITLAFGLASLLTVPAIIILAVRFLKKS